MRTPTAAGPVPELLDEEPGPGPQRVPRSRAQHTPYAVGEVLRLLVVVLFAGAGYLLGVSVGDGRPVLGALIGTAIGLVVGSGQGYVLDLDVPGVHEVDAKLARICLDRAAALRLQELG